MQVWVSAVVGSYGSAATGGVAIWELDNKTVWWSSVHQNIIRSTRLRRSLAEGAGVCAGC